MDLRKLKTLIDLVAESGISELEVTEENDKVRIVNKVQTVAVTAPVAAAPAPAAACPSCGGGVQPGQRFCPGCGTALARACSVCGSAVDAGARFCAQCGNKL